VVTALFRFLTSSFNNDHFVHLTAAQQILFGDWPTRDFIDIGRPLQIVASAVPQRLLGHTLFAEAVLVSAAFGVAAALTAAIVFSLTGSLSASFAAVVVEAVAFPRPYAYPKLLATALGLWLIGYYLRRPSAARQVMMAAGAAIAFLFRHDLGLFVAIGGMVASLLAIPTAPWRTRCRSGIMFAAMGLVLVTPYLVYVQLYGGLWNYFATALQQTGSASEYAWPSPFARSEPWEFQLLYLCHLLPIVVLAVCATNWKRMQDRWETPFLISIAVVAVVENFGLIRGDALDVRIPDAVVPAAVLGAWLGHHASTARPRYVWIPVALTLLAAVVAFGQLGNVRENLNRAGVTGQVWLKPQLLALRFAEHSVELHKRFARSRPSRAAGALDSFILYLDRCTTQQHRLFLGGLIPEVAYLAQRPFAGGGYEHYNFASGVNQRRVVEKLRREVVPFALIPSATAAVLDSLPIVAGYLDERYVPLADFPLGDGEHIRILVDHTLPAVSRDGETGWPCFT